MGHYGPSSTVERQPARPAPRPAPKPNANPQPAVAHPVHPSHGPGRESSARMPCVGRPRGVSRADAAQIAAQLGIMLNAGVPLTQALEGLQSQSDKPHLRDALQAVLCDVRNGSDLSVAVARCPYPFPAIFAKLLRAAEASGTMGAMLIRTADYLDAEVETIRKVRAALAYPVVMMGLGVVAMVVIFGFLLPRFEVMYAARQAMLPVPTQVALAISRVLRAHWIVLTVALLALVAATFLYIRSPHGRITMDWLKLHIPLVSRMFRHFYVARSFQTLGTMVAAGVTVPEAVRLSRDVAENVYFMRLWDLAEAHLQAGQRLADPLFASPLVSNTVAQLVSTGERSGDLAGVMQQIAALCERQFQHTIKTVTALLEPLMIVILGGMIGGIVMAIMLPVFRIAKLVGGGH
jgi:type II secretory pathway component PulF